MQSEYLQFHQLPRDWGKKTDTWEVKSKRSGSVLGEIHWYGPWRQYCFYPSMQTIFNSGCLFDLQKFLDNENQAHRQEARRRRALDKSS